MIDTAPSTWAPRVLDVKAQEKDRPIFAALHQATADAVGPVFLARFKSLAAAGVADELLRQTDALRTFLLNDEPEPSSAQSNEAHPELRQHLSQFLQDRLPEDKAAESDRALARQMALEFAGGAWATLISRLHRQRRSDAMVDPSELLPDNLLSGQTALVKQVGSDARHFGLSRKELNDVMAKTLSTLLYTDTADPEFLRWPLGLRVDRQALRARVQSAENSLPEVSVVKPQDVQLASIARAAQAS